MHIKTIMLLMCLEVLGERFFWERLRYIAYPDVLDMKYRWELKHGFTNYRCLFAKLYTVFRKKDPTSKEICIFFFKMFKMFKMFYLLQWKRFKNDEKCFLFHLFLFKALLIFKMFEFFCWLFGHVKNPGLIRKIRLTLKFMTS